MKTLTRNKKADMNVMIMVFMTVIVFVSMLFIFVTSQRNVIKDLASPEVIEAVYLEQAKVTFYVNDAAEKALIATYDEIGNPPLIEDVFKTKFEENFYAELNPNQGISYLTELKAKFDKIPSEITFIYNKDNIEILVKGYKIRQEEVSKKYKMIKILYIIPTFSYTETITQLLGIYYNPDIKVTIPL